MIEERLLELPGADPLPWRLHRRRGIKHCYIHLIGGEVELRCPVHFTVREAEALLRLRLGWIEKKRREYREKSSLADPFESFLLEGRNYPVELLPSSGEQSSIRFRKGRLEIRTPSPPDRETLQRIFEDLYRNHCRKELLPGVHDWSRIMGLTPSRIGFRRARTRWGSCSSRDALSLNIYLSALPRELSDYVIVHELAHIRHKNHSKRFWSLVEKYLPDWRERRKALRRYEGMLG
jgi:predicted metal-dependent hydrolase